MLTRFSQLLVTACLVGLILFSDRGRASAQDLNDITLDDIVQGWRQRGQEIRSGRFAWTVQAWESRQTLVELLGQGAAEARNIPDEGRSWTEHCSVVFDGARYRFEKQRPTWQSSIGEYREEDDVYVWDGNVCRSLLDREDYPMGDIWPMNYYATQSDLLTFQYVFRMDFPGWHQFQPDKYVIADRNASFRGSRCLIVETSATVQQQRIAAGRRPLKEAYWVSPQHGFSILRYTMTVGGTKTRDFTIMYKEDPQHGWYPAEWTTTFLHSSGPYQIDYATMTEAALNVAVDPQLFELQFPEGTVVKKHDENWRVHEKYLVQGGKLRLITEEEQRRAKSYEQLLEITAEEGGWMTWLLWGGALIAVALIALGIKRRLAG